MTIDRQFKSSAIGAMRLPEELPEPGLLVGWSLEGRQRKPRMGFSTGGSALNPDNGWVEPLLLGGEGHLLTIAPTGAGKGRGCIIPALLRHEGPVIVIDPKGENVEITARRRREMGQQVVVLDPMGITDEPSGSLNPLDLIDPESADSVDIASMFANALIDPKDDTRNIYWYQRGQQLMIGLMLHASTLPDPEARTFKAVREMLAQLVAEMGMQPSMPFGDYDHGGEAVPLLRESIMGSPHPEARIAGSILQNGHQEGVGSIVSMAEDGIDFIRGPLVEAATRKSSFDLAAITRGDPISLYIVMPPHMLESHGRLLRLWIMSLMSLITRRRGRPEKSTLFLLDEAAQLGTLPQLRQAMTLLRGYGVQTWSFWQDASQLRQLYPGDWEVMLNNCSALQCFGAMNLLASGSMAQMTGYGDRLGHAVLALDEHEMLLQISGEPAVVARKPDYLTDPVFAGEFDTNPYHANDQPVEPPPPPRIALHSRYVPTRLRGLHSYSQPATWTPPVQPVRPPPPPPSPGSTSDSDDADALFESFIAKPQEPSAAHRDLLSRLLARWPERDRKEGAKDS